MDKDSLQQTFLRKIKDLMPAHYSLADELAELLAMSVDSAYRRIRGETALSIDEIVKICKHYRLSFDALSGLQTGSVLLNYKMMNSKEDFRNYLLNLLDIVQKVKNSKNGQVIYMADDIPLTHHFHYKEQAAFKMFYWLQSILNEPSLLGKKFAPDLIDEELLNLAQQVGELYEQVPSIEIWTDDSANSTLKQIAYYWESGLFEDKKMAFRIVEQMLEMFTKTQKQAEMESKTLTAHKNYQIYQSEIQVGNNCILVYFGDVRLALVRHQTINTLSTSNPNFCEETEVFLKNIMRKSILISGTAERQRYQFFQKIQQSANRLLDKMLKD